MRIGSLLVYHRALDKFHRELCSPAWCLTLSCPLSEGRNRRSELPFKIFQARREYRKSITSTEFCSVADKKSCTQSSSSMFDSANRLLGEEERKWICVFGTRFIVDCLFAWIDRHLRGQTVRVRIPPCAQGRVFDHVDCRRLRGQGTTVEAAHGRARGHDAADRKLVDDRPKRSTSIHATKWMEITKVKYAALEQQFDPL